jgi:hypothetical protein
MSLSTTARRLGRGFARTCVAWRGRFDLVTVHFVLEHVAEPADTLRLLATLLSLAGKLYLSVPNSLANPGDLLVVDHLSHFSKGSLGNALLIAGLHPTIINETEFPGALLARCEPLETTKEVECAAEEPSSRATCPWRRQHHKHLFGFRIIPGPRRVERLLFQ